MLAAWFSGRHVLQRNEHGNVLIHLNREPDIFFYILEFCKHKTVSALPTEGEVLERLAVEYDYFVLPFPYKRPNSLQNVFLRPLWRDMQGGAGRELRSLAGDSRYAVAVAEQVLLVWDITTGHLKKEVQIGDNNISGALSVHYPYAAAMNSYSQMCVWNLEDGSLFDLSHFEDMGMCTWGSVGLAKGILVAAATDEDDQEPQYICGWSLATGSRLWCERSYTDGGCVFNHSRSDWRVDVYESKYLVVEKPGYHKCPSAFEIFDAETGESINGVEHHDLDSEYTFLFEGGAVNHIWLDGNSESGKFCSAVLEGMWWCPLTLILPQALEEFYDSGFKVFTADSTKQTDNKSYIMASARKLLYLDLEVPFPGDKSPTDYDDNNNTPLYVDIPKEYADARKVVVLGPYVAVLFADNRVRVLWNGWAEWCNKAE